MTTSYVWRARWGYADANGNQLQGYAEQSADFIAAVLPGGGVDPASLSTAINNNFPTPPGTTILLLGVSNSQTASVYS